MIYIDEFQGNEFQTKDIMLNSIHKMSIFKKNNSSCFESCLSLSCRSI